MFGGGFLVSWSREGKRGRWKRRKSQQEFSSAAAWFILLAVLEIFISLFFELGRQVSNIEGSGL